MCDCFLSMLDEKLYGHTDYITRGKQFKDIFHKTQRRQPMWLNLDNQLEDTIDNAQWSQTNENQGTLKQPFVGNIWIFTVEMKINDIEKTPAWYFMCILKLFSLEKALAHGSHAEGPSLVCSGASVYY